MACQGNFASFFKNTLGLYKILRNCPQRRKIINLCCFIIDLRIKSQFVESERATAQSSHRSNGGVTLGYFYIKRK